MNLVEKRDYLHSHLHQVDESLMVQFYEILRKEEVFTREEIEQIPMKLWENEANIL